MKHAPLPGPGQRHFSHLSALNHQIDFLKFQESSGNLKWLPVVAGAFLRQLPQWRLDFEAALADQNRTHQLDLLHKIKGACYAVAAYGAIEVIAKAEAQQARGKLLAPERLLQRLALVEADLQAIIADADVAASVN